MSVLAPRGAQPCHLLLIVGLKGSGKTTALGILRSWGFAVVEMSAILKERLPLSMPVSNDTIEARISAYGRRRLMAEVLECLDAQEVQGRIQAISGMRSPLDLGALDLLRPITQIIEIRASFDLRLLRILERGRLGDCQTRVQLRQSDRQESAWGLDTFTGDPRVSPVFNESTVEALRESLNRVVGIPSISHAAGELT